MEKAPPENSIAHAGGAMAPRLVRRWIPFGLAVFSVCALYAPRANALEAFDGRLQAHGFFEIDTRAINRSWSEQTALTQWYNILNVEFEADIAPDGFGPIDLLSAFVRVEARYDCIYTQGCGVFPMVRTFGNDSRDLPDRLSDAKQRQFGGTIPTKELVGQEVVNGQVVDPGEIVFERRVLPTRDPATPDELSVFEGLFDAKGADPLPDHRDSDARICPASNAQCDPDDENSIFLDAPFVSPDPPSTRPATHSKRSSTTSSPPATSWPRRPPVASP
jgi:hypothetical protein